MRFFITIYLLTLNLTLSHAEGVKNVSASHHSTSGQVDIFYVGSDDSCGFDSIQDAIDAANNSQNATEVRIARNMGYFENLQINNNNILIDGSYANCADAQKNIHIEGTTIINDESESGLVTINITGFFVHIKGVTLTNNDQGGIYANETSVIILEDMKFNQLGTHALHIDGSNQIDLTIKNSIFINNSGDFGAAIYSLGSNHSIEVTENTEFSNNTANDRGGAIYIIGDSDFSMTGGKFEQNNSFSGGGFFAYGSNNVNFNQVIFSENAAMNDGGALRAAFSTINLEATHFLNNESIERGGAINISDGTDLILKRNSNNCLNSMKCNLFDGNSSKLGGALYLWRSQIDISSTYFENNRANIGTSIYSTNGSSGKIEGSIFIHNGNHAAGGFNDQNVIQFNDTSSLTISYSTFADNNALFSTFRLNETANLSLYSSIIYDSSSGDVFDIEDQATYDVNCLIVQETSSFDANNAFVTITDPMFVDPANGDYHIDAANSPAVDYCTDTIAMGQFNDIDNQSRGYDDQTIPNNPDTNGFYDIGADETYNNDIIFADGFED